MHWIEFVGEVFASLIVSYLCFVIITWWSSLSSCVSSCGSVIMSSLDVSACLHGLQDAYNESPRGSRSPSPVFFEDQHGGSGGEKSNTANWTATTSPDPNSTKRVSQAEEHLLQLLERDEQLDEKLAEEKKRRASKLAPPKPIFDPSIHQPHSFPCKDTYNDMPSHPTMWPQRPVMIRPTPYTTTKVRGIRKATESEHKHYSGFCAGCVLPVNNGTEVSGDSIVVDFESSHFLGTMLLRIKDTPQLELSSYQDKSYFDGKKRRFQALIRGRFKTPLKMSECVTGQSFDRPAGKLPARWIVTSFIKFVTTLAPQLEATVDGHEPRFLTPLVATAHTVLARERKVGNNDFPDDLETPVEEPPATDSESLVNQSILEGLGMKAKDSSSAGGRMKARKKVYNEIAAKKMKEPCFSTDKEYTFEFYQHMLDFGEELAIDMGRPIGKVGLAQATDGQPIKVMAAHKDPNTKELDTLWSFDLWHESLYPYAEFAYGDQNGAT